MARSPEARRAPSPPRGPAATLSDRPTLAAGDFDGDDFQDLAGYLRERGEVVLVRGIGQRRFGPTERIPHGEVIYEIAAADWDGDDLSDLLLDTGEGLTGLMVCSGLRTGGLGRARAVAEGGDRTVATASDGKVFRLRGGVNGLYSTVEMLRPGNATGDRRSLPLRVQRIDPGFGGLAGRVRAEDQTRIVWFPDVGTPCSLARGDNAEGVWAGSATRSVIAGARGAAMSRSLYFALWQDSDPG